jgi:hypothetical protein
MATLSISSNALIQDFKADLSIFVMPAGLLVWYDMTQETGYVNNSPMGLFRDLSGNGRNAITLSHPNDPLYQIDIINNKSASRFVKSPGNFNFSRMWEAVSIPDPAYFDLFVVMKILEPTFTGGGVGNGPLYLSRAGLCGNYGEINFDPSYYSGSTYRLNNVDCTSTGLANLLNTNVYELSRADGVGSSLLMGYVKGSGDAGINFDLCELIAFDATLSTDDRTAVYQYLKNKWATP